MASSASRAASSRPVLSMMSALTSRALTPSEQLAVERIAFKRAWSLAGKPLGKQYPAVAQPIYFKGSEVGIAGAQIANGDPVVGARRFYSRVKAVDFIAMGGQYAALQGQHEACDTSNTGHRHQRYFDAHMFLDTAASCRYRDQVARVVYEN